MKRKNLWIAVFALLLSGTFASAQERQIKEEQNLSVIGLCKCK